LTTEYTDWPYWVTQWTVDTDDPDGRPDDPANDCGPAAASAVEVWLGGEYVPPDTIRDWIMGEGGSGYTTFAQLGKWLRSRGLRTEYRWGSSDPVEAFREAYLMGDAVMALFRFRLDQPASGHFMAVTGVKEESGHESGLVLHDPWTGTRRTMTAEEWPQWWKGELMVVRKGA